MSHGKSMMLTGSVEVTIAGKKMTFKSEEKYGLALSHGKVSGNSDKAQKSILGDLNLQYDKAWKKAKIPSASPDLTAADVSWDTYSAK